MYEREEAITNGDVVKMFASFFGTAILTYVAIIMVFCI